MAREESPPPNSHNQNFIKHLINVTKAKFRSASLPTSNAIPMLQDDSTSPNPRRITRSLSFFHRRSPSMQDSLPVYIKSLEATERNKPPPSHGKTILQLTFPTVVTLALTPSGNSSSASLPLELAKLSMVVAFAVFVIGLLLRNACPKASNVMDKVSSMFALMGFFLIANTNFSHRSHFEWIGWLAFALCLLSSIVSLVCWVTSSEAASFCTWTLTRMLIFLLRVNFVFLNVKKKMKNKKKIKEATK